MGVWGRSPQRGAGAEPLLIGVGDGLVVCVLCVMLFCVVFGCVCVLLVVMYCMCFSLTGSVLWTHCAPLPGTPQGAVRSLTITVAAHNTILRQS